jgi:SagB-type dehydrogenase family enzyme
MSDAQPIAPVYDEALVSELFHENSKQRRSDLGFIERIVSATVNPVLRRMLATAQKSYPAARRIRLPATFPPSLLDFDEVVLTRRSAREFTGAPLELGEVAKLLQLAYGITGSADLDGEVQQQFRASPSGGALYPLEVYALPLQVRGLRPGVYHYHPAAHALEEVARGGVRRQLERITHTPEIGTAAVAIALTGISAKSRIKYGERGYRFMLLEAGHVAQNLLLTARALRLGAVAIGGFVDDELDALLDIDGVDEVSLYLVAIGRDPAG